MSKLKIYWITLCKNEEDIIPWCIQYWSRIADKVIVYDNHSTDSSVELLSKYDWIEVRTFDSDGQNDILQKEVKEQAYLEFKDECSLIIISDMDEIFYFSNKAVLEAFAASDYNILMTPIFSLCESNKPPYSDSQLLHEQCHKFYKQRMNHMKDFDDYSKLSIFNTKTTSSVSMSVGQHYVRTAPTMKIVLDKNDFCLHIDKGLSKEFFVNKRMKMGANLSDVNKRSGLCIEYLKSKEELEKEYDEKQKNAFDINETRHYNNQPQQ